LGCACCLKPCIGTTTREEVIVLFSENDARIRGIRGAQARQGCLEILQNSEVVDKIRIVNGLERGNISRALAGENPGTIIYKE
jgi:hypothetical protein